MGGKYRFKLTLLGDGAVGKTSLFLRYIDNKFEENYIPTLGVNFLTKDLEVGGTPIRLIVWDIGGQSTWKAKLPLYLKGSDGAIIIFDLTRPASFLNLSDWIERIHTIVSPDTPFIVVGNKNDLKNIRKVKEKDVKNFLKKQPYNMYYESSAKTGENIDPFFEKIASEVLKRKFQ